LITPALLSAIKIFLIFILVHLMGFAMALLEVAVVNVALGDIQRELTSD
jgi:hypothetical protein